MSYNLQPKQNTSATFLDRAKNEADLLASNLSTIGSQTAFFLFLLIVISSYLPKNRGDFGFGTLLVVAFMYFATLAGTMTDDANDEQKIDKSRTIISIFFVFGVPLCLISYLFTWDEAFIVLAISIGMSVAFIAGRLSTLRGAMPLIQRIFARFLWIPFSFAAITGFKPSLGSPGDELIYTLSTFLILYSLLVFDYRKEN